MLVWNAMPSITPTMSALRFALALIAPRVATAWLTTCPPSSAALLAAVASALARHAVSALALVLVLVLTVPLTTWADPVAMA